MSQAVPVTRICGSRRKTRLSDYNPGTFCTPCERALYDRQHLVGPGVRDDMAAWVWETGPMRDALARLDFPAVLVIYRSAAGLSRRELGERTGLSESVIWYWEAGRRQGIYDIRQLLQFADSLRMPRPALLPVILGQPDALRDLLAGPAATALAACAGAAGHDNPRSAALAGSGRRPGSFLAG
jgi:transcriptional regulator with XRE-family HTH domain